MVCDTELCFCRLCNFDLPNKQRFSLQKHKSCKKLRFLRYSACAEFLDNLLWLWHRALGVAQSFGFVAQSFATLVCQRNCVFLCKGTKLKNSACAEFLDSLLWGVAQSFALWHRAWRNGNVECKYFG